MGENSKVRIIVDSSADLLPKIEEKVCVVPLMINFGGEEFVDRVQISHKEFYEKLEEAKELPTTSQPSPELFAKAYEEATQNGGSAVVITLSGKLSGTYQSAMIAAEDFEGKVFVVNSSAVTIMSGVLVEYALSLAESGMDAESIAKELDDIKDKLSLVAVLDTLEYLKKGGRISKTVAFAGGLLAIKPLIEIKDGVVEMAGKVRGAKQVAEALTNAIEERGGVDTSKPFVFGYTGNDDSLLKKYLEDSRDYWKDAGELRSAAIGSVVGTHAGPGAIAVAFFKKA
ncbi:MAG: DegV family protein [Oscillospiraceae bacterium]|nr:DegV family protein [Oscillospiraceae bacterium]